jgi:hypothetical protein
MFDKNSALRSEYPRDLGRLYGYLEDHVYDLFDAVKGKKFPDIKKSAGDIIVTASEIIEYASALEITFGERTGGK